MAITIDSFSPTSGPVGTTVTVHLSGLQGSPAANDFSVAIGGKIQSQPTYSSSAITFKVVPSTTSSTLKVSYRHNGDNQSTTSSQSFTVTH